MKNLCLSLYALLVLIPFRFLYAQSTPINPGGTQTPVNPGSSNGTDITLKNPIGDKDILEFLQDILDVIMIFAVPLIVFMIIYAGFLFVMDRGSEKNLKQAKNALLYAVIGAVIIFGAKAILEVVQGTVDAFR
ncbi:MAG: TrbC/VIRB2 family protein [bacterium ADurb.Bin400]|nr:MAG: TrbC/VIRB2 family protein [bacterium ADurb.Bin400]